MDNLNILKLSSLFLLSLIIGCSSSPKVERVAVDKPIDLSGAWNDVDAFDLGDHGDVSVLAAI